MPKRFVVLSVGLWISVLAFPGGAFAQSDAQGSSADG